MVENQKNDKAEFPTNLYANLDSFYRSQQVFRVCAPFWVSHRGNGFNVRVHNYEEKDTEGKNGPGAQLGPP